MLNRPKYDDCTYRQKLDETKWSMRVEEWGTPQQLPYRTIAAELFVHSLVSVGRSVDGESALAQRISSPDIQYEFS